MNTEVYQLGKELDSFNYQQVQDDILAILEKGSSEVKDVMDVTGFSNFFDYA
jgi:hypothetical protein